MVIVKEHRNDEESRKSSQKLLGRGGFIFYKPDPADEDFSRRYSALPYDRKKEFVKAFASEFVPKVFETYGLKENDDFSLAFVDHFKGDEEIPTIQVRFLKSITYEEMEEALLDVATVLKSHGDIEVFDTYDR